MRKNTNKTAEWQSCDLWGEGGGGDCACILPFAVNEENSTTGPYNKHKEFIKTQKETGEWR